MQKVWLNPYWAGKKPPCAVIADRDGTLIEHVDYLSKPSQMKLIEGVRETLEFLKQQHIPLFVHTNQSGVGRGYFSLEELVQCQDTLWQLLEIPRETLGGWAVAPEKPSEAGPYRKPSPRFIKEVAEHLQIPVERVFMVGDAMVDLETAWNAGAQAIAVQTGKAESNASEISKPFHALNRFLEIKALIKKAVN